MNSKKRGDVGLGLAIGWFVSNGYTVSLPLTDSQPYDLIVDKDNQVHRVQVKTTSYKKSGSFNVSLTIKGGNQSYYTVKKFDHSSVELIFIVTSEDDYFLIPTSEINGKQTMSLGKEYEKYRASYANGLQSLCKSED